MPHAPACTHAATVGTGCQLALLGLMVILLSMAGNYFEASVLIVWLAGWAAEVWTLRTYLLYAAGSVAGLA